ncbi:hypothetical protein ABBQ38_013031 [Trebouxia sp. C0009 RCD-2024]
MGLTINVSVAASHTIRLRPHHVQPRLCQQSNANLGFQYRLSLSGRQDRSCFACCIVPADAPDQNVETAQQVRYRGVSLTAPKTFCSKIMVQGERHYLGTYTSPGEAACVYDEACIFLKKEPVNFPMSQYDVATILQIPDFETFVKQKKATGKPKARTSRFNGVSRNKSGKWLCRAQLKGQLGSTQVRMSAFPTEEMAARAHDKMRIYQVYWRELEPQRQQVGSICTCRSSTKEGTYRVF